MLRVPLVQLLDSPDVKPCDVSPPAARDLRRPGHARPACKDVAKYADGVGPVKDYIVPRDATGHSLPPTTLRRATRTRAGPASCTRTRSATRTSSCRSRTAAPATDPNAYGNAFAEDQRFFDAGVDGIFTDNPDTGVAARNEGGF